jgi:hypothetical protein
MEQQNVHSFVETQMETVENHVMMETLLMEMAVVVAVQSKQDIHAIVCLCKLE